MAKQTISTSFLEGLDEQPDPGDCPRDCFQDLGCIVETDPKRNA
jgi:hypothetical protein